MQPPFWVNVIAAASTKTEASIRRSRDPTRMVNIWSFETKIAATYWCDFFTYIDITQNSNVWREQHVPRPIIFGMRNFGGIDFLWFPQGLVINFRQELPKHGQKRSRFLRWTTCRTCSETIPFRWCCCFHWWTLKITSWAPSHKWSYGTPRNSRK